MPTTATEKAQETYSISGEDGNVAMLPRDVLYIRSIFFKGMSQFSKDERALSRRLVTNPTTCCTPMTSGLLLLVLQMLPRG